MPTQGTEAPSFTGSRFPIAVMIRRGWAGLTLASGLVLGGAAPARAEDAGRITTTVYIGKHFEMRDYDQPVKYVFNGDTRVARVSGSLSGRPRFQRLRLQSGWNLCCLAVGDVQWTVHPAIDRAYSWNPVTGSYEELGSSTLLPAGAVLWIKANRQAVVVVAGTAPDPAPAAIPAGGGFGGGNRMEAVALTLPSGVSAWKFDAVAQRWQAALAGDLAAINELPPKLAPGEAIYLHTAEATTLPSVDPASQIAYYHQDHLGSTGGLTDADGTVVQETTYHPFGAIRHTAEAPERTSPYRYGQKERDQESALVYFGQRYLLTGSGRWLSTDPLGERGGGLNPYAYVNQNPLKLRDPDGAEIKVTEVVDRKSRTTTYTIHLKAALIDVSSSKFSQQTLADFRTRLATQIEASYTGSGKSVLRDEKSNKVLERNWNYRWSTSVDLRVIDDWKKVGKDDHVFRLVDRTKQGGRGESNLGGMLMDIKASTLKSAGGGPPAEETGAHEFGHTGRLEHDNHSPNLMTDGGLRPAGTRNISLEQIQGIGKAAKAGQLNQRDPVMGELDEIARRR